MSNIKVKILFHDDKKYSIKQYKTYDELLLDLYLHLGILANPSIELSNLTNLSNIPLFDIFTQNIVLVNRDELYHKIITFHYRPITKDIIKYIIKKKSLNFINNFDIQILEDSFYKLIYKVGQTTDEITTCIRPSFLPILRSTTPYYRKSELIYLALNMNIWKNKSTLNDVCERVSNNDITGDELLLHKIYIEENVADNYIKYYSFLGSSKYNEYLRFPNLNNRNKKLEYHINNFRSILINSPGWNKSYYLYRWIKSDEYLYKLNLKPNDIWIDTGFLSTTRQAFVSADKNYFGFILIKIRVPKGKQGSGLAIEFYSHFPEEQEIIFPPSKYKLISSENISYFHPDSNVSEKVVIKYEFEWIEYLKENEFINISELKKEEIIPLLDINTYDSKYYNIPAILNTFYNTYKNGFVVYIGNEKIEFSVDLIQSGKNNPYNHMFYTNNIDIKFREMIIDTKELYLTWQNDNGDINLAIEVSIMLSINYYFKYSGMETKLIGNMTYDDIFNFIVRLGKIFNSDKIIINSDYKRYSDILLTKQLYNKDYFKNYHNTQLYISDINYFNQILYYYTHNIACQEINNISKFSEYIIKNENLTSNTKILQYLFDISLEEFITNRKHDIIHESYIDLIFKLASKILNNNIKSIKQSNIIKSIKQNRSIIISNVKKIIDLYIYIINEYNYLIPYFHAYIYQEYNINMDDIKYQLDWRIILNEPLNIYMGEIKILDIVANNNFKLNMIKKEVKQYKLID